jgi:hypothetical protein
MAKLICPCVRPVEEAEMRPYDCELDPELEDYLNDEEDE